MKCSSTCSNCEPDNDDYITALNDVEVHTTPELEDIAHELPETTELSSTSNTTASLNISRSPLIPQVTTLETCSITYFSGYLVKKCLEKYRCKICQKQLINENKNLEDTNQILILNKTFNFIEKAQGLKAPSNVIIKITTICLNTFEEHFDQIKSEYKIMTQLKEKVIQQINFLNIFNSIPSSCQEHYIYIIELLLRTKIFKECKWENEKLTGRRQTQTVAKLRKRINFSQRQSYNTRVEAAVVSYNTSGEFLRKLHKNVVNEKSPGDIGKKYLKTKRMKSEKRKCKKLLFSKKVKKFSKQTGPDQHYGLAEPLLDDIPLNELESKKSAFIQSLYLDHDKRIELEIKTREQANSQIWHTERRNRITGSNFGRICKMRPTTLCRSTVYDMLYRSFTSKSTDYGKAMENKAIIVFQNGFNCAVEPCGLIVDDDLHYLAATPDGLVGTDYVVEIKCPLKAKDSSSFIEAVMNKKITFCRIQNENEMELKKEHNYYYQIQGQMHVSKRKFCYFVVYTANWYKVQIIEYDESFWSNKMVSKLEV
ncbi:hypothetical protein QTP88_015908 [Uroleucon formosanum]